MSEYSRIEWTESTWNPVTGCKKISPACENCYAEAFANRFRGVKGHPYEQGFRVKIWPKRLELPFGWKEPRKIFVNSMSDLYLEEVHDDYIKNIFDTMALANWHIYQILTKRAKRMADWCLFKYGEYSNENRLLPNHIWMGVSVETEKYKCRIEYLKKVPAKIRFISFEPLLGQMDLDEQLLKGIDWVIVGGESGPKARRMRKEWVDNIFETCKKAGVLFFFKQWGTYNVKGEKVGKARSGRSYNGRLWNEMPISTYGNKRPPS